MALPDSPERNLLFGLLALQNGFVTPNQLVAAFRGWSENKAKPLVEHFIDCGLTRHRAEMLGPMVDQHIACHGGDPAASLAKLSSIDDIRVELSQIADADVLQSLQWLSDLRHMQTIIVPAPEAPDPEMTIGMLPPGPASSAERFVILRPHAKGGLGKVSVALDTELNREVAFKQILPQHAAQPDVRNRFVREAEITGGLEHPGIVPVYGLGVSPDGQPYYAMKFIRGVSLHEAVQAFHAGGIAAETLTLTFINLAPKLPRPRKATRVPPDEDGLKPIALAEYESAEFRQLLQRFIDVCQAIQYAHDRGVLHRDLKPGNVMLGEYGETLVVDWGLAKPLGEAATAATETLVPAGANALADTSLGVFVGERPLIPKLSGAGNDASSETQSGSALGTPAYMSPEQAAGRIEELNAATDIYALGATLYAVVCGRAPVSGASLAAVLTAVQKGEFPRPRTLQPHLPKPLEAICLKAMALDPKNRYSRAQHLAAEIERYLADEPVAALPDRLSDRAARFTRRHRGAVLATLAAMILIAIGTFAGGIVINNQRIASKNLAEANGKLADKERGEREKATQLAEANRKLADDNGKLAIDKGQLAEKERAERTKAEELAKREQVANQRNLALLHESSVAKLADGIRAREEQHLAASHGESGATTEGWAKGHEAVAHWVRSLELESSNWSSAEELYYGLIDRDWSRSANAIRTLRNESGFRTASFSPDGTRIVSASWGQTALVWDAMTGRPVGSPMRHEFLINSASFSPDGTRVVIASHDKSARVWDAVTGQPAGSPLRHEDSVISASFSPDGTRVVTASFDKTARVGDAATGQPVGPPLRHESPVYVATFSPDGTRVVTGSDDNTARLWDAATGQPAGSPLPHRSRVDIASFSPDGTRVVTASYDLTARVWDAATGQAVGSPLRHEREIKSASFSPDGTRVVTASFDKTARVWDAATGQPVGLPLQHEDTVTSASFSPDGTRVVTASDDKTSRVWDAATGQPVGPPLRHEGPVSDARFSPDGTRVVTASFDKTARVWDVATDQPAGPSLRHENTVNSVKFSPDGTRVVTASKDRTARIWDATTGQSVGAPLRHGYLVISANFSEDGTRVVTASWDKTARVWDAATGQPVGAPLQHEDAVISASFSPDGTRVVTCSFDSTARVWDAATGQPVTPPLGLKVPFISASFSPDGTRVVTASWDRTARVWDAATGQPVAPPIRHEQRVWSASFSPDGTRIVTACEDKTARVWDATTGQPVAPPIRHEQRVWSASFSPDGTRIVTLCQDNAVRVWHIRPALAAADWTPPFRNWIKSIVGLRLSSQGELESVPLAERDLSSNQLPDGDWKRLAIWLRTNGPNRTIHPESRATVREVALLERDFGTDKNPLGNRKILEDVLRYDPPLPLARLMLAGHWEQEADKSPLPAAPAGDAQPTEKPASIPPAKPGDKPERDGREPADPAAKSDPASSSDKSPTPENKTPAAPEKPAGEQPPSETPASSSDKPGSAALPAAAAKADPAPASPLADDPRRIRAAFLRQYDLDRLPAKTPANATNWIRASRILLVTPDAKVGAGKDAPTCRAESLRAARKAVALDPASTAAKSALEAAENSNR